MQLNKGLPKWPQMYVTGVPVTAEQAKEIIRRTDSFFVNGFGGNNHTYNDWVNELLGFADTNYRAIKDYSLKERKAVWDLQTSQRERWGCVYTEYVRNSWLSCAFINGPHGWCHPDGQIGFIDNVGKWPSVGEISSDWKALAKAFPFIEVGVTLWDCESCHRVDDEFGKTAREEYGEPKPVVSMLVKGGKVYLRDPEKGRSVHKGHPKPTRGKYEDELLSDEGWDDPKREQGVPDSWIYEWAALELLKEGK